MDFFAGDDEQIFYGAHDHLFGEIAILRQDILDDEHLPVNGIYLITETVGSKNMTGRHAGKTYNVSLNDWKNEWSIKANTSYRVLIFPKGPYFARDSPVMRPKPSPYGLQYTITNEILVHGKPYMVVFFRYVMLTLQFEVQKTTWDSAPFTFSGVQHRRFYSRSEKVLINKMFSKRGRSVQKHGKNPLLTLKDFFFLGRFLRKISPKKKKQIVPKTLGNFSNDNVA